MVGLASPSLAAPKRDARLFHLKKKRADLCGPANQRPAFRKICFLHRVACDASLSPRPSLLCLGLFISPATPPVSPLSCWLGVCGDCCNPGTRFTLSRNTKCAPAESRGIAVVCFPAEQSAKI